MIKFNQFCTVRPATLKVEWDLVMTSSYQNSESELSGIDDSAPQMGKNVHGIVLFGTRN